MDQAIANRIKAATLAAVGSLGQLNTQALKELTVLYQTAIDDLTQEIKRRADNKHHVSISALQSLKQSIDARLQALFALQTQLLNDKLADAAAIGTEPFKGVIAEDGLTAAIHAAIEFVANFKAQDGLQLSDRLWRLEGNAKDRLIRSIQTALVQGMSASQAANDFLRRQQPVPVDVQQQVDAARVASLSSLADASLLKDRGSDRYKALRLFHTEMARAHHQAYEASAFQHPDVVGMRFTLAKSHKIYDVCDGHASENRHGLGGGVFPRGLIPLPAHPNGRSFAVVVFRDEV